MTDEEVPVFSLDERAPIRRRSRVELLQEAVLATPNMVKLLYRLMRDPRVPRRRKLLVGGAAVYMVSPIDLVPEMLLPVLGQLDDLVLMVFSIHHLLRGVDEATLAEYWDGSEDALELVSALLEWGSEMVPGPLRKALA